MRLFVAVEFDDAVKNAVSEAVEALRAASVQGSFTRRENLHLTLAFIGETNNVAGAKAAVAQVKAAPFAITLEGLGTFRRPGGDIHWMGMAPCPPLTCLAQEVQNHLVQAGFVLEERNFTPHLTLGRRVLLREKHSGSHAAPACPPLRADVRHISLMQSHRVNGVLTYTPVLRHKLVV